MNERGIKLLICTVPTGSPCDAPQPGEVRKRPPIYGAGRICGAPGDYNREYCCECGYRRRIRGQGFPCHRTL